ncbi:MAG: 3-dehydroquinate synthase [Pseudomonadota bacterium]
MNPSDETECVRVDLGKRSYDILIGSGLLEQAGTRIAELLPIARAAIVCDENVAAIYLKTLQRSLSDAGIDHAAITVPAGELSKSFAQLEQVVDGIIAARLERSDAVIALGGGVVGDLAGFASGIVRRGMKLIQIPTSLLAQVDSSVGGKTGINTPRGKNLVGVFQQPELVLADDSVLDTLNEREFRAGYAEVIKYGMIDRPDFFQWLEDNWQSVFSGGSDRRRAIAISCQAKADVVANDELEAGQRALLNLGHTFGHALEASVAYNSERLVHGEAVAIGMALAQEFSSRMNLCGPEPGERLVRHLGAVGLPSSIQDIPGETAQADVLLEHIQQDKKVKRGALTFILLRGVGEAFIADDVPPNEVLSFLKDKCKN